MISAKLLDRLVCKAGNLPAFAWPGGYPIVYTCKDGESICPDCANGMNGSLALECQDETDNQWYIVSFFVHYEGEPEVCSHCNTLIGSAYGDPNCGDPEADNDNDD